MALNFIGGRPQFFDSKRQTVSNNTFVDFPETAKGFRLHPDASSTVVTMETDGHECVINVVQSDAGTLFPFRPQRIKFQTGTIPVVDTNIEYLY